ncbi:hypothetical protein BMETH_1379_0 [methanotrophic bacterial endosymbiont of Bathymodiolus sp.]|nr:hypothetical protein BMETH_1379_0 [methanotrophic bacterial endosymbiont of Bathymodiolus sp.]
MTCLFIRFPRCSNSCVACYAPITTPPVSSTGQALKTNKNTASNFRILLNPHS